MENQVIEYLNSKYTRLFVERVVLLLDRYLGAEYLKTLFANEDKTFVEQRFKQVLMDVSNMLGKRVIKHMKYNDAKSRSRLQITRKYANEAHELVCLMRNLNLRNRTEKLVDVKYKRLKVE